MRILFGWDDAAEAELISLYMNVDENACVIVNDHESLLKLARSRQTWDVIVMPTNSPDLDSAFATFQTIRKELPEVPIVGACHNDDVYRIARFMTAGMRTWMIRDPAGDYMFLLQAMLESVVAAVRAEHEQRLAAKLREEIDSVRKLQESIIPSDLESPDGYAICARYEPSQIRVVGGRPVTMAGGDYYDVFTLPDGSMVILVGDASGHGMKACMSIMTMHTLVRMIRNEDFRDTAAFVSEVNKRLCEQTLVNKEGGFITLLYGILRPETEEFQWTSAGHPVPIVQNMDTGDVSLMGTIDDGGLPLAIIPEAEYDQKCSRIPPRCRVLIYTDGLEEAFPQHGDVHDAYGFDGIKNSMKKASDLKLDQALDILFRDSTAHTKGAGRHDDTSVVFVERAQ